MGFKIVFIPLAVLFMAMTGPAPSPAPKTVKVKFTTSKGDFVIEVTREWAPRGVDRFLELVKAKFYDDCRLYRVVPNWVVQFGINGDPKINARWKDAKIQDDPVKQGNTRGRVSFAMAGPNTRTTQLFINFADNSSKLDAKGFAPIGEVIEGMDVVDKFYSGYGDLPERGGKGPSQGRAEKEGNAYLNKDFPQLDFIKTAQIIK